MWRITVLCSLVMGTALGACGDISGGPDGASDVAVVDPEEDAARRCRSRPCSSSPPPGCIVSTNTWVTTATASQSGAFVAQFDVTPTANADAVIGLSAGVPGSYADLAAIVRFSGLGVIDARSGGGYTSESVITYTGARAYHVRLVGDVAIHTYDAYVTPAGGSELVIGRDLAFRSEQTSAAVLTHLGVHAATGTAMVCNVGITAPTAPPPTPPSATTACNDGIDNDGDGTTGGGGTDYPADLGCWGPDDTSEGFPDDATTGVYSVGTALRGQCATLCTAGLAPSGSVNTAAPGTTIQCLDLTGNATITVDQSDTTVRCVRAVAGGVQRRLLVVGSPDNVTIEDSHLSLGVGSGDPQNMDVIYLASGTNIRVERNELSEYGDGIKVADIDGLLVRDNWIHAAGDGGNFVGSHADSIEMDGGMSNVVIEGDTHQNLRSDTSMLMLDNWGGSSDNVTVRRNNLIGADDWAGYTIYCNGSQSSSPMTHHVFAANLVQQSQGWPADWDWLLADGVCAANVTVTGNRNADTGTLYSVYSSVFGGGSRSQVAPGACNDGLDNDGDGKIDWGLSAWNDPGCVNGMGGSE